MQKLTSIELDDILSKGGVADINIKKQMLINKIKNNEIDHDKYMKVIKAISDKSNEPDFEASEVIRKGNKGKQGPIIIQNQGVQLNAIFKNLISLFLNSINI